MKNTVSLIAGVVLLVGCGRGDKQPETKKPATQPAPVAVAPTKTRPVVTPVVVTALPKDRPAVPPAARVTPVPAEPDDLASVPTSAFLQVPPASILDPASDAGRLLAEAQELFRQGQVDAAIDTLAAAVKDPAFENGRQVLVGKLVSLLLASARVADAQAVCMQYPGDERAVANIGQVNGYLTKIGDMNAAADWAAQLEALPLSGPAADQNSIFLLSTLAKAGRIDEAIERVPGIVEGPDEARNIRVLNAAAGGMLKSSDLENGARLLAAIEEATGGNNAYAGMVSNLRVLQQGMEEMARTRPAGATPK